MEKRYVRGDLGQYLEVIFTKTKKKSERSVHSVSPREATDGESLVFRTTPAQEPGAPIGTAAYFTHKFA